MADPYRELQLEQNVRRSLEDRLYAIEEYAVHGKDHPDRGDDPLFQKILHQALQAAQVPNLEARLVRATVEGYRLGLGLDRD